MRRIWLTLVLWTFAAPVVAEEARDKPILVLDTGGHLSHITQVLFRAHDKRLISTSTDKTIRIWDVSTGETVRVLRLPLGTEDESRQGGGIHAAALSPDGFTLAVAAQALSEEQQWIYLVSLADTKVVRVLKGTTGPVHALAFSPDGTTLASGARGDVLLWDVKSGASRPLRGDKGGVHAIAFSPDGKRLATGGSKKVLRIWSAATGKSEAMWKGLEAPVKTIAWSRDSKSLASWERGGTVRVWGLDGMMQTQLTLKDQPNGLSFSPDGRELLAGKTIIDLSTTKERIHFSDANSPSKDAALSHDGQLAAWGGYTSLYLWDPRDGKTVHRLGEHAGRTMDVGWNKDGKGIFWQQPKSTLEESKAMRLFDLVELKPGPATGEGGLRAQHRVGDWSLERTGNREGCLVKRGEETIGPLQFPAKHGDVTAFTFLGEKRVAATTSHRLFLFDASTGRLLRAFKGASAVWSVAPSPDNRFLVTGHLDQILRVWNPEREEPLLSLFVTRNEWIAWTPEGYYAASPGGERLMGWQVNNGPDQLATFHPARQFHKSLYRPEMIRHLLQAGSVAKALEAASADKGAKPQATEVDKVLPPKVTILTPKQPDLRVTEPKLRVQAAAESFRKFPVTSLLLLLDDRPYEGQRGVRSAAVPELGKLEKEWTVTLPPGTHRLSVLARSDVSSAVSEAVEVTYTPAEAPNPKDLRPSLYVLTIGLNAYPGDLKLDFAVNDAAELQSTLVAKSNPLFRQVQARTLTDQQATRQNILGGLAWLKREMKPQDVAAIFYAGHGHKDKDGRFYLLSIDMDENRLEQTTVTGEELKKHLADLPGRVLLMLDACHSGAIGGRSKSGGMFTDDLARDLADDDCGVVVMCAAMGREESRENTDAKHGYFTLALIEGLSGKADYNRDGLIHLTELDLYVDNRVTALSKDGQHPVTAKPTTIRSFALSKP